METKKRKLEVENAFANYDACIVCGFCVPEFVPFAISVAIVFFGGE